VSKFPPYALLLATLTAVACVIAADAQAVIVGLGLPALVTVLASARGRRTFGRRLLLSAPLVFVAVALRWLGQAPARDWLPPALRIVSAIAWSSCLSMWLGPNELRLALSSFGAPRALLELIAHTRRFAGQLAETASEAWNAAALRAGLFSLRATARTVGHVAGVIVVRAFDRAECVAIAAALRGGDLPEDASREACPTSENFGYRS
jgi:energy-coupling factor transporter transmembrane protein EcfT